MFNVMRLLRPLIADIQRLRWMRRSGLVLVHLLVAFTVSVLASTAALATDPNIGAPPVFSTIDGNGVDLGSGALHLNGPSISVGPLDQGGLVFSTYWTFSVATRDNLTGYINISSSGGGPFYTAVVMGQSFTFRGTSLTPDQPGNSLVYDGSRYYTFTGRDGTVAIFDNNYSTSAALYNNGGAIISLTYPNGEALTFYNQVTSTEWRLLSVTNNLGYQIKFNFSCVSGTGCFSTRTRAIAINNAIDYCDPTDTATNACTTLAHSWPTMTAASGSSPAWSSWTDAVGNTTTGTLTYPSLSVEQFVFALPSGRTMTYQASTSDFMAYQASDGVHTWTYGYVGGGSLPLTATVTDPLTHVRKVTTVDGQIVEDIIDPGLGHLNLDTVIHRPSGGDVPDYIQYPEGNQVVYTYDARENVTSVTQVSKTPHTPADITTYATYPAICDSSNFRICNKPTSITDGRSATTYYTYDPASGALATVTRPAIANGTPKTIYTQDAKHAWYKDGTGSIVQAATTVYRQVQVSACAYNDPAWGAFSWSATSPLWSVCEGTARETKTVAAYSSWPVR